MASKEKDFSLEQVVEYLSRYKDYYDHIHSDRTTWSFTRLSEPVSSDSAMSSAAASSSQCLGTLDIRFLLIDFKNSVFLIEYFVLLAEACCFYFEGDGLQDEFITMVITYIFMLLNKKFYSY